MTTHPDYNEEVKVLLESYLFSPAYYRLCEGLEDIHGLIAYGTYKEHKRQQLLERPLRRGDRNFHEIHNKLNDSLCEILQRDAQQRLKAHAAKVITDATPQIQRDYITAHVSRSGRKLFWKGVAASMTASFFMLIVFETAPILARQGPTVLADVWNELQSTEETDPLVGEIETPRSLGEIEPAAGAGPRLGDGRLLDDACLTDSDTLNDPGCRGDY